MTEVSGTLVIVEDNADLIAFYELFLEKCGHKVITSLFNGRDAVEFYRSLTNYPDLIIMDHRMPFKDGLTASQEILAINPNQNILMISADDSIKQLAHEVGIDQFLRKPFSLNELETSIVSILGIAHSRR